MTVLTVYIWVPIFQLLYMMSDENVSILLATSFFLKNSIPTLKSQ